MLITKCNNQVLRETFLCKPKDQNLKTSSLKSTCAMDGRSFFIDCQSFRELWITVHNNCSMPRTAPGVGSQFKCNGPFYFSERRMKQNASFTHMVPPPPAPFLFSLGPPPTHYHPLPPSYCTPAPMHLKGHFLLGGG
jgi:hypothetical protein